MKVSIIVAGSRTFNFSRHWCKLVECLDTIISRFPEGTEVEIVSGKAKGADEAGEKYAALRGNTVKEFPADWSKGKGAGYARNVDMAKYAAQNNGLLVAFWDGESKGTKHMIDQAEKYGLDLHVQMIV